MTRRTAFVCLYWVMGLSGLLSLAAQAQDHPMFARPAGYVLNHQEKKADVIEFPTGFGSSKNVRGTRTFIMYNFDKNARATQFRLEDLAVHYQKEAQRYNGRLVYSSDNFATFSMNQGGKDVYLVIETYEQGASYSLTAVETSEEKDEYAEVFAKTGKLSLYINFSTGSSTLPEDASQAIEAITRIMQQNQRLKISIEGHTDNVGSAESNKTLSEARAKAVMESIAAKGIPAARMTSKGWGQEKPVAPNSDEAGRNKNRRVEIIKVN